MRHIYLRKLNQKGFAHWILPLLIIVIVTLIGVKLLTMSHAQVPPTGAASASGAVRVPAAGAYFGSTASQDVTSMTGCSGNQTALLECKIAKTAQVLGISGETNYHFPVFHSYINCGDTPNYTSTAETPGRQVLVVSVKCGKWADTASGKHDSLIKKTIDDLKNVPDGHGGKMPIIVVFHHEPENDSCDGSGASHFGLPRDYRAAFQHFVTKARDDNPTNLSYAMVLMGYTFNKLGGTYRNGTYVPVSSWPAAYTGTSCAHIGPSSNELRNPNSWYPGDGYVDWIMNDPYDQGEKKPFQTLVDAFVNWDNISNTSINHTAHSKPLGLTEWGTGAAACPHPAHTNPDPHCAGSWPNITYRANWLNNARSLITAGTYPAIKLYDYWSAEAKFNYVANPPNDASNGNASIKAFTRLATANYFKPCFTAGCTPGGSGGGGNQAPSVTVTTPAESSTVSARSVSVTADASDPDGHVTSVVFSYKAHAATTWTTISTDTVSPYAATWDTSHLRTGSYDVRAVASDNGTPVLTANDSVTVAIGTTPPPISLPDLIVTSVSSVPGTPLAGQGVTFSAVVKNQGTANVPEGTYIGVAFKVDGTKQTWSGTYTSGLATGASVTLTANNGNNGANWTATPGAHVIVAQVNDLNKIHESNVNNNFNHINFTVQARIDGSVSGTCSGLRLFGKCFF